jgi:hypothetical protein
MALFEIRADFVRIAGLYCLVWPLNFHHSERDKIQSDRTWERKRSGAQAGTTIRFENLPDTFKSHSFIVLVRWRT